MLCQRRCGSLRRQRLIMRSTSRGMPGPVWLSGTGSECSTDASVESFESPEKARRPVTISYNTAPNEKMSERASTGCPSACSGDM